MSNDSVVILFLIAIFRCLLSATSYSEIRLPTQLHRDSPVSCPAPNPNLYYQPVIGILSHPGDGAAGRLNNATSTSYIAASYVKFVEAAGARVVPLIYTEPPEKLLKKLELVNGILFTGGWAKEGLYFETVGRIFKKALEKNDAGDHFPLYAICLGFELVSMIISETKGKLRQRVIQKDRSKSPPSSSDTLVLVCLVVFVAITSVVLCVEHYCNRLYYATFSYV